ncbi:hypothetical protein HNR08_003362 [Cellulomonas hominis]|uniref:Uncharacterized protein n=1 Tax=Cellulomonas hominis TaxID=156981 RepID=A0A7W8SGF0_9CELL|nr:hypothetical protein [Cellulomonas hominis]MBB5474626.1 hypothetical protein [Cellulomonas hominis]
MPAGIRTGGQFSITVRAEAGITLLTAVQEPLRGMARLRPGRPTAKAALATDVVARLDGVGAWRACDPVPDPGAAGSPPAAVQIPGQVLIQPYADAADPTIFLAELDPSRDDPWAQASFWRLDDGEMVRLETDWHGRTYEDPDSHTVAGAKGEPDPEKVAAALAEW